MKPLCCRLSFKCYTWTGFKFPFFVFFLDNFRVDTDLVLSRIKFHNWSFRYFGVLRFWYQISQCFFGWRRTVLKLLKIITLLSRNENRVVFKTCVFFKSVNSKFLYHVSQYRHISQENLCWDMSVYMLVLKH